MTATPTETKWLTPEQVAARLPRGNADWVRIQLRKGALRGSKVGGAWFVEESALTEMIEAGSNSTRRRRRRAA